MPSNFYAIRIREYNKLEFSGEAPVGSGSPDRQKSMFLQAGFVPVYRDEPRSLGGQKSMLVQAGFVPVYRDDIV